MWSLLQSESISNASRSHSTRKPEHFNLKKKWVWLICPFCYDIKSVPASGNRVNFRNEVLWQMLWILVYSPARKWARFDYLCGMNRHDRPGVENLGLQTFTDSHFLGIQFNCFIRFNSKLCWISAHPMPDYDSVHITPDLILN